MGPPYRNTPMTPSPLSAQPETSHPDIRLIIGLGNPGDNYQQTYHNAGLQAISYIRDHLPSAWEQTTDPQSQHPSQKHFTFWKLSCNTGASLILAQPTLFMNESGVAVHEALRYFTLTPQQLMVVHDDSDLLLGAYKFSFAQRSGGHRGIASIIDTIGTNAFYRFKIGIRPPLEKNRTKAEEFVLKKISSAHRAVLETTYQEFSCLLLK